MSHEGRKWICQYCTYENWPKAMKCTICLTPRPPHLICDEVRHNEDREIYKMAPLIKETSPDPPKRELCSSNTSYSPTMNPYNKWSCHVCTYLNWPRATKCTQCRSPRKRTSPTRCISPLLSHSEPASPGHHHHHHREETAAITATATTTIATTTTTATTVSPTDSRHSSPTDSYYNDRNKSWTRSIKWACPACTYENWPKAAKCVLCYTSRPKQDSPSCSKTAAPDQDDWRRPHTPLTESSVPRLSPPGAHGVGTRRMRDNRCCPEAAEVVQQLPGSSCPQQAPNNYLEERRLRQLRRKAREADWVWLNACVGVVEGDPEPVIQYLSSGGDPARQLTQSEVALLARPSAFDVGHTLVHLAIRFQKDDLLAVLLSNTGVAHPIAKRVPSDVSRDIAAEIRRHISASLKQRKGDFPCYFVTEFVTFALPAEIDDFPPAVQERLYDELLDRDVQKELEEESPLINWSLELTERLGSRLYALWNRSAGDCLLDSALQATWGVFDRDNMLRQALGDSLCEAANVLYPRWKEAETLQANLLQFTLDETQWQEDWAVLLSLAAQPGSALEQMHIFTLAHILRRPIIVYGVKYVKSFRGEALGYARFEGIYLPLLWEPSFCWKSPIALGYTRGHFSALVPMEPDTGDSLGAGANLRSSDDLQVVFLPLMTSDQQLLPLHFLTQNELGREEEIMRQWLDCCVTEGGILVAQQKIPKRPILVSQMVEEWLDFYRNLTHHRPLGHVAPATTETHPQGGYSSDGDSDQE